MVIDVGIIMNLVKWDTKLYHCQSNNNNNTVPELMSKLKSYWLWSRDSFHLSWAQLCNTTLNGAQEAAAFKARLSALPPSSVLIFF